MTSHSVLFRSAAERVPERDISAPEFFGDLHLDQIVAAVTAGKAEYDLEPFFWLSLSDADQIVYRQEVMRDLEQPGLFGDVEAFADSMRTVREHLSQSEKLRYELQKQRWFLDAAGTYCEAVARLAEVLAHAKPASRGLRALRDYVGGYVASERFTSLVRRTEQLVSDLSAIRYSVLISGGHVQVRRYDGECDYGAEVDATFETFKQRAVEEYGFTFGDSVEMNHVEAMILDQVAKLYPRIFSALERYAREHEDFADPVIVRFDREVQFYVAYLHYLAPFRKAGLNLCYPRVTRASKDIFDIQGFDLALAGTLLGDNAVPVCNDFHLRGRERVIVVSGPNQGGKTTFARTFGQLHYLASLGLPVPGARAQLFLFDKLFTHFEREEDIANLRGKLQDDLVRIHDILARATPDSVIVMNEVFTSTTFHDAGVLSRKIAAQIIERDLLCVWVTFLDELASLSEKTVSMVSTVVPENPARRTYKILRRPADGLAYALSIAEKHRLTYGKLKERLGP